MLKSFTSIKRPTSQSLNSNQHQNHKCYFHDSYLITKFCSNKKCTLPLCQKCLPIHIKQHLKEQPILGKQNIIPFSSAYQTAIQNLHAIINYKTNNSSRIKQSLSNTKKQLQDLINQQLAKIQSYIHNTQNQVKIMTQKLNKIQKGSLKSLIFYFSDQEILKNKHQPITLDENKLAEIPVLIQKLKSTVDRLSNQSQQKISFTSQKPVHSDSISKAQNHRLKNYSSSFFTNSSNDYINSIANPIKSLQKSEQNVNTKLQSSSDFSLLLKQQRSRLQSVRNKNISFVNNYSSQNRHNAKLGSKSVDNFYFSIAIQQQKDNRQQNQSRPLQIVRKDYENIIKKGISPKKTDLNSSSQQKLSKIKQKYIGEMSLTKENIKTDTKRGLNIENTPEIKYLNTKTPIHGLKPTQNQQRKSKDLDSRILSREQIRVNIENRLNQKSISLMPTNKQIQKLQHSENDLINFQGKQLFSDLIKHQTLKQPFPKQKIQQFTLNKNYHQKESFRQSTTEIDRVPMSSIKRQLRADTFTDALTQPAVKKFFEDHSQKSIFSNTKNTLTDHFVQSKNQEINLFFDKNNNSNQQDQKAKIIHRKNIRNQFSKDLLYDQAKLSIKLNDPNGKNDEAKKSRPENKSQHQTRRISESKRKDARRFNYLYDAQQQVNQFNTQQI